MNGLNMLLDTYHLNPKNGVTQVINELSKLNLSAGTCNHFIKEALVDKTDELVIELPESNKRAQLTLSYMVQDGIRNNLTVFSQDQCQVFIDKANAIELYDEMPSNLGPADDDELDAPKADKVVRLPKEPKPVIIRPEGAAQRGRLADPNSPMNRAKGLYDAAEDKSRDAIVALFIREFPSLSAGTALTYYYNARKA